VETGFPSGRATNQKSASRKRIQELLGERFLDPGASQTQDDLPAFIRHFYGFMRGGPIRQSIEDQFAGHFVRFPARGLEIGKFVTLRVAVNETVICDDVKKVPGHGASARSTNDGELGCRSAVGEGRRDGLHRAAGLAFVGAQIGVFEARMWLGRQQARRAAACAATWREVALRDSRLSVV
jgi:hypothetical protein